MRAILRSVLPMIGAVVMAAPFTAHAQDCFGVDIGTQCALPSSASTANITPGALGFVGPVTLQVRYLGGLAGFGSNLYFFDGFNVATLIGGKGEGDLLNSYGAEEGWMSLTGSYDPTTVLKFGMQVFYPGYEVWLYSGLNANSFNIDGVDVVSTNSRIFNSGTTPVAPSDNPTGPDGLRVAPSRFGSAYPGGTFVGFEDNIYTPDLDFNDGIFQIRGFSTVVPEPSAFALLAAGLLGLGVAARRRRQS